MKISRPIALLVIFLLISGPLWALFLKPSAAQAAAQIQTALTVLPQLVTTTPTSTEPPATATPPAPSATPTETAPPPTATATSTELPATPTATATPTQPPPTPEHPGYYRPVVVISSYRARPGTINPGSSFNLEFQLVNQGQLAANNVMVTFVAGEVIPRNTGGLLAVGQLQPGETRDLSQPFTASSALLGTGAVSLEARFSYTDQNGTPYSESFSLAINTSLPPATPRPPGGGGPTATPTAVTRPQLIIQNTSTDVEILQPGTRFTLELEVVNAGSAAARRVTMIAGGASIAPADPNDPDSPGGVTASGGEFTNFSPLGGSNVRYLGDLAPGESLLATQALIVNVSTNPGAYSFKFSFSYYDEKETLVVDDQVITLLVYQQPVIEVNFYRDPGPLFAGQPNGLPLQIINLGRKSVVLGNMKVTVAGGQLMNNTILVGPLESGGYFTLDATLIPEAPGPLELNITVDYTDDFNQHQTITRTVQVEILEPEIIEPPPDLGVDPGSGLPPEQQAETFWQTAMRFLRGMVGLDSGHPQPAAPAGFPGEGIPLEEPPPAGQFFGPLG